MCLRIEQLQLVPIAERGAQMLQSAHPEFCFTSGRRTILQQAEAMAVNVCKNRKWIEQTYLHAQFLQAVVDQHPEATTVDQVTQVLFDALLPCTPDELDLVSKHFTGHAFDGRWVEGPDGEAILATCWSLPGVDKVLTKESNVRLFHVQFHPMEVAREV
jgi:hypothetical protein